MNKSNNYNKVNLRDYQQLIKKFINFIYKIIPNIILVVRRLSKYNIDPKKLTSKQPKKLYAISKIKFIYN